MALVFGLPLILSPQSALFPSLVKARGDRYSNKFMAGNSSQLFPRQSQTKIRSSTTRKPGLVSGKATNLKASPWLPYEKAEVIESLGDWVETNMITLLKPVEEAWQPHDFLPDSASDGFYEQVKELQERVQELPDEYLVVLVGDLITEEALPTYETIVNNAEGIRDITTSSSKPWARWTRGWTAEENRHGDLLNKYLYLSGRVDMKYVEKTVHYLIRSGADSMSKNDTYRGIIYASFQERATHISHTNTARLANQHGDTKLAQICGTIAADEKRHEVAYVMAASKLFEVDPYYSVLAFADMMRMRITMPGQFMYDGHDENLFAHFSAVAQKLGVYTAKDYADIVEHLVDKWKVEKLIGLSSEAAEAQDFLCQLAPKIRKLDERIQERGRHRNGDMPILFPFKWIFSREVKLW
ncbi:hypothetical protein Nepgr_020058 [Nepenthes gracilis]|uniref:Stearoyl-[acyl-carrier-protein] 9-desaturase, chloroplastic n=1 Tax=Nepenthes gracilis TaxID=150966 RepID=A0AAD3SWD5_NEPGR|nr:hypothetical protein Nepgr_020058 [Nepenthes gracilis]